MFEGGFSISHKGISFSLAGGKYDKGLNPSLSITTFKETALSDLEKLKTALGDIQIGDVSSASGE